MPTYALTATCHGRIPAPTNRDPFLREVIDWAEGPYARAVAEAGDLPADEKAQVTRQMAGYTGLRVEPIEKNDLRILPDTFGSELLRDKGKVIGDFDTRYTGDVGDGEKSSDFHPAYSAVRGIPLPGAAISAMNWDTRSMYPIGAPSRTRAPLRLSARRRDSLGQLYRRPG